MKSSRKFILIGVVIAVVSCLVGLGGVIWNISASFSALETPEIRGIGAVGGGGIERALIFTILSIVGLLIGILLVLVGGISHRKGE
ncbi:MAG TPA: hypothetical protein PKA82_06895 [Pyrinomonadaceae bacterium]|nr:hypothetical protein [Pyrinomonadaceae bacterium]